MDHAQNLSPEIVNPLYSGRLFSSGIASSDKQRYSLNQPREVFIFFLFLKKYRFIDIDVKRPLPERVNEYPGKPEIRGYYGFFKFS